MKRATLSLAVFLFAVALAAQTLPELFQKAKAQIKGEAWQDALKTLDALEVEAAKPGNEGARSQLQGPLAFYRGVCDANLDKADAARADFEAFLAVQPNASIDASMYSKKAVTAFEAARDASAVASGSGSGGSSLFTRFQEFKAPPNISEPVDEKWADGPVRWIMTAEEKRTWSQIAGADRTDFVEKFWEARNPQPGSSDNTYRTGFERRVAFADAYLVQDEEKRGSLTDRGMVFVLLGPPTYVGRKPLRTGEDTSEAAGLSTAGSQDAANAVRGAAAGSTTGKITSGRAAQLSDGYAGPGTKAVDSSNNWREVWHYRKELLPNGVPYLQVDVEFVTRRGYGLNILQREPQTLHALDAAKKP